MTARSQKTHPEGDLRPADLLWHLPVNRAGHVVVADGPLSDCPQIAIRVPHPAIAGLVFEGDLKTWRPTHPAEARPEMDTGFSGWNHGDGLLLSAKHCSCALTSPNRAWLYEDVLLFKRGLAAPQREECELQHLFVDAEELQARLVILPDPFAYALRRQRWDLIPKPDGALVGGTYYWQRTKVQHWLKGLGKRWAIGASLRAGRGNAR